MLLLLLLSLCTFRYILQIISGSTVLTRRLNKATRFSCDRLFTQILIVDGSSATFPSKDAEAHS